jgi:hypothetical protein
MSHRSIITLHPHARVPQREARLLLACVLLIAWFERHDPMVLGPTQDIHGAEFSRPVADSHRFYFGGQPLRGAGTPLHLGPSNNFGGWARFLHWGAAPPANEVSCLAATPPGTPGTKSPKEIASDLPGLYGAPWVASINGELIAALNIIVPRNPAWQPAAPVLQIYRHGASKPDFSQRVPVSVTRGSNALLYRMFINGPIRCIDLLIPNGAGTGTAYLYYPFRGRLFEAEQKFTVQR